MRLEVGGQLHSWLCPLADPHRAQLIDHPLSEYNHTIPWPLYRVQCTLQYQLYLCYIIPCQKVVSAISNVKSNTSFNTYIVMHCGEIHVEAVNNIICI